MNGSVTKQPEKSVLENIAKNLELFAISNYGPEYRSYWYAKYADQLRALAANHVTTTITQESPMQETIKALGMTFTPVETTVKGRRLSEFKPLDKITNGTCTRTVVFNDQNDRLETLTTGGTVRPDLNPSNEWYLESDWVDGKPRSVPQTKTIGELKPGEVCLYNSTPHWMREMDGKKQMVPLLTSSNHHPGSLSEWANVIVTVIGTLTWSRP